MLVKELNLSNYRNISSLYINADYGMNVICGENAQGKTNIIEAIWLFTGAKSFRTSKESNFIKIGESSAKNKMSFFSSGVETQVQMIFGEKRTAYINEKKLNNPSALAGNFNAVVFSPTDLTLVSGGPDKRRRFLDISIGQLYPNYIEILRSYTRAVMQRNQIIKDYKYDGSLSVMLDVFEKEIADCGEKIVKYRKNFLEIIGKYVPEIYYGLSGGKEKIEAVYVANNEGTMLLEKLKNSRKNDMYSGVTSVGPHRDDIEFKINNIDVRNYGSQGQKRSVALSLKLAGAEVINEISGEYPVCLLDDVMSELDVTRQNYILNHIRDWQSFITCCDPSNVQRLRDGKIIEIRDGAVV